MRGKTNVGSPKTVRNLKEKGDKLKKLKYELTLARLRQARSKGSDNIDLSTWLKLVYCLMETNHDF